MFIAYHCVSNSLQAVTSDATVVAHGDSFFLYIGEKWFVCLGLFFVLAFTLAIKMNQDGPTYETVRVLKRERVVLSDSVGSVFRSIVAFIILINSPSFSFVNHSIFNSGFLADLPLTLRSVPNAVSASFQLPLLLPLTVSHEFSVAVSPILPTSSTVSASTLLPLLLPITVSHEFPVANYHILPTSFAVLPPTYLPVTGIVSSTDFSLVYPPAMVPPVVPKSLKLLPLLLIIINVCLFLLTNYFLLVILIEIWNFTTLWMMRSELVCPVQEMDASDDPPCLPLMTILDHPCLHVLPIIFEHPIGPAQAPARNIVHPCLKRPAAVKQGRQHHVSWSKNPTTHTYTLPVKGNDEVTEIRKWNDVWMMRVELLQTVELVPPVEINALDESPARDNSASPPMKRRRVRARRTSQHSRARTPVRVECLPLKHRRVDNLFKKRVLARDDIEEPGSKRGKRFHKTSPPVISNCRKYNKALREAHAIRVLQHSRSRAIRALQRIRSRACALVTEAVDMEMVDMEMVDVEMVLEVGEVKEIKACSLPSFVETAKADKEHKETVSPSYVESFNIEEVQDSSFFCGVDEIEVEEKVDDNITESFGFESLVDGRGRQYKRSLRNKKKMTNDICLELLGSENGRQLRRSLRTKHRKKPIYC